VTISFAMDGTITLNSTLTVNNTNPNASLTIDGSGKQIVLDGGKKVRVLNIHRGTTVNLKMLTIEHGNDTTGRGGGGILNQGALTIDHCMISSDASLGQDNPDAPVQGLGGGIYGDLGLITVINSVFSGNYATDGAALFNGGGTILVDKSTFSDNAADDEGGAIDSFGTFTLRDSAIYNNSAQDGGGIVGGGLPDGQMMTIENSTIYHNSAAGNSGGIDGGDGIIIRNSTVTGNMAARLGGGVTAPVGSTNSQVFLQNTIIAGNSVKSDTRFTNVVGVFHSLGHNIIGDTASDLRGFIDSDQTGVSDAKLGPLDNYGGTTQTIPLLPGSPAIGKGDCGSINSGTLSLAAITTDQRGMPRGTLCDVGAFEGSGIVMAITSTSTGR